MQTLTPMPTHNESDYDALRGQILNDETAYCEAVNWMGAKAQEEGNHTYVEDGKVYHKNATELTRDGYLDKYIEFRLSQQESEAAGEEESDGCKP